AGSPAMEVPSETWAPTGNMAQARSGASAALLQDGSVLIAGGANGDVSLASAELFKNGSFSATGSMLLARSNAAAVALKDGRVLITGGSTASGPTSETEIYDPATGSWTIGNSMAASRWGHTATLLADGRVLIAGGQGSAATVSLRISSFGQQQRSHRRRIGRYCRTVPSLVRRVRRDRRPCRMARRRGGKPAPCGRLALDGGRQQPLRRTLRVCNSQDGQAGLCSRLCRDDHRFGLAARRVGYLDVSGRAPDRHASGPLREGRRI